MRKLTGLALLLLVSACHTSIKEIEPSEAFREALEEVMSRQDPAEKIAADSLKTRQRPVLLKLSLEDCIDLATAHNRAILFEQLNVELAAADVVGSKSNLDFTLGLNVGYSREQREVQARFFGDTRTKDITGVTTYGLGATLPFATGTTLDIQAGFVRSDSNSPFQSFEFYPTTTLKLTQHLLNGMGFVPNLGNTYIAEGNERSARQGLIAARNQQVYNVAIAYWDLVGAQEDLNVLRRQEELAIDALALAKNRLEAEIGTRLDVLQQRSNLAAQQRGIIAAETLLETRTDELLYAIHPDLLHGYAMFENYRVVIEPQTQADTSQIGDEQPVLIAEVKGALQRRAEIKQAREAVKNAGISVDMAEFSLLPTLDLELEFGVRGFGADTDKSLQSYGDFNNLRYGFNFTFGVPLQNRTARSAISKAAINKRNAILAARDAETLVILEVADATRQIKSARRGVDAAMEAQMLAKETHEAEGERHKAGLATAFEVKQALNDSTSAERDLVAARIELEKARLLLLKATGELGR